ncbi:MAG: purine-nucleoside phosphorylase [Planctomycetota bacterium]|nr:purine-nucleoside phosphorylase [Planctomycetota bacterium]
MTEHCWEEIQKSAEFIRERSKIVPKVGIILGTGLGALAKDIVLEPGGVALPYQDLPGFPISTAPGHKGQLVIGHLAGVPVAAMEGRFHLYEGYTAHDITFPVRVLKALGCSHLFVSNACGGLNPIFRKGDLMVIDDHINLMGVNPLVGPNDERLGPRFPDMSEPYNRELQDLAIATGLKLGMPLQRGVYAAMVGPNLETRAEYRFLRTIGSDVIGMSTIPEVMVAVHQGMKVLGFSIVTDMCFPEALSPVSIDEIIAVANTAEAKLKGLVMEILKSLKPDLE